MPNKKTSSAGTSYRRAGVLCVIAALVLAASGYGYFRIIRQQIFTEKYHDLSAVSELKTRQIAQWRKERIAEIARAAKDKDILEALGGGPPPSPTTFETTISSELAGAEIAKPILLDVTGKVLVPQAGVELAGSTLRAALASLDEKEPAFSNFFRDSDGNTKIDLAAPICDREGNALAVLILRYDASSYLFPLIQWWPTPSRSAETLLVQREGDSVVLLNNLRFNNRPPLSMRFPLSHKHLPAVRAAEGAEGLFEGQDYRGADVVANLRPVESSPWHIVAKIDWGEIRAEAAYRAAITGLIVALYIALIAFLIVFFFRKRQAGILAGLTCAERQKNEAEQIAEEIGERHSALLLTVMDGFFILDSGGWVREVNAATARLTGYSMDELLKLNIRDLDILETLEGHLSHFQKIVRDGRELFETCLRRKDGSFADVEVSAHYRPQEGSIAAFTRDISARKTAEAKILRLSRLYSALSECNKAVAISSTREALFEEICKILVENGGMQMVWIPLLDPAHNSIAPASAYGTGMEYLDDIRVDCDAGSPYGQGPIGRCIRQQNPIWCQHFQSDPLTAPWHERAKRFGWMSSAAVPIRVKRKTIGCIAIYCDRIEAFDGEVRKLITEMGDSVSFALDHFSDEEERKKAEKELLSLRTAIEQTASTVIITDPRGTIQYANPAFEKTTGIPLPEAIRNSLKPLNSGAQNREFYEKIWEGISAGSSWKGELQNRRSNGDLYWEFAIISPVRGEDGNIEHFIAVKEDITSQKAMAANLKEALLHAEEGSRAKSEFLAVMSHELRTPLNGVLGFAELLTDTHLDPTQADYVKTIRESGTHLLSVVNDILDFSSLEKGSTKLDFAPVAIVPLLKTLGSTISKLASDKGLSFRVETGGEVPPKILGDGRRIRQVLLNLLGNAIKFTSAGSIVVRVEKIALAGNPEIEFAVTDTGPGIDPLTLEHLFEPFTQADTTLHRPYEGTGLGLAISKRLAQAMGGEVTVTSTPGKGSTFRFRVPARAPDTISEPLENPATPKVARQAAEGQTVLIVEDDRVNRMLAGKMIESLGYETAFAGDGAEGVRAATSGTKFAAILMDMQLPSLDGLEATKAIRAWERGSEKRTPIIALTANVMPGDKARCIEAGMDAFLNKPFSRADLAAYLGTDFLAPLSSPSPGT